GDALALALATGPQPPACRGGCRKEAASRKTLEQRASAGHRSRWHRAVNASPQRFGRGKAQITALQGAAQIPIGRKLRGTSCALRRVPLDIASVPGIELVVDERMQHDFSFVARHERSSSAIQAARNIARARARRDITVPTGTPVTSAISR